MEPDPVRDYVITEHAAFEMERRGISDEMVRVILATPEQRLNVRAGRVVLQSRMCIAVLKRICLVRVFVDVDRHPAEVVTVYHTSKILKYWREEQ